jgi:hypothetical protein
MKLVVNEWYKMAIFGISGVKYWGWNILVIFIITDTITNNITAIIMDSNKEGSPAFIVVRAAVIIQNPLFVPYPMD